MKVYIPASVAKLANIQATNTEYYLRKLDCDKLPIKRVLEKLAIRNGYKGQRQGFFKLLSDFGKEFCSNYSKNGWTNKSISILNKYGFEEAKLLKEDNNYIRFEAKVFTSRSVNGHNNYKTVPFTLSLTTDKSFENPSYFQLF